MWPEVLLKFTRLALGQRIGEWLSGLSIRPSLFSSDTNTVVGLPRPIHESIKTLKQVSGAKGTFGFVWSQEIKVSLGQGRSVSALLSASKSLEASFHKDDIGRLRICTSL